MLKIDDLINEIANCKIEEIDVSNVKFKHHKASKIEPEMNESDFNALKNDIILIGRIKEPVVIVNDMILDGRHRQKAAIELNMPMPIKKLNGNYTINVLKEFVRSHHMGRNKVKIQKEVQSFEYKQSVANVSWESAAARYGVSVSTIKRISQIFNKLKEIGLDKDFARVLDCFRNNKNLIPMNTSGSSNAFQWISRPVGTIYGTLTQLKEYIEFLKTKDNIKEDEIDITEFDPNTGEVLKKDENIFIEKTNSDKMKIQQLEKENQELKEKLNELIETVEQLQKLNSLKKSGRDF